MLFVQTLRAPLPQGGCRGEANITTAVVKQERLGDLLFTDVSILQERFVQQYGFVVLAREVELLY